MVMGDITRIDTVQQYCDLFEVEALHPLVSVVNCYEVQPIRHSKKLYNIYAVLLKDTDCGTMNYGRSLYDYEKAPCRLSLRQEWVLTMMAVCTSRPDGP